MVKTACKGLRIDRFFSSLNYEYQRVDAIASERLTSAPEVMDIYGFCGMSALNELSSGLRFREMIQKKWIWDPLEMLELLLQASTSLARVHSIDYRDGSSTSNATLVHNDITHNNFVMSRLGIVKLNDFNRGILLRWNCSSNERCGFLQRRLGGAGGVHVVSVHVVLIFNLMPALMCLRL